MRRRRSGVLVSLVRTSDTSISLNIRIKKILFQSSASTYAYVRPLSFYEGVHASVNAYASSEKQALPQWICRIENILHFIIVCLFVFDINTPIYK